MRIRLDIAYVGTRFVGWQRQPGGRTVQQTLEHILSQIYGCPILVAGAGRTDAGVHAAGQVAHFDAPKSRPGPADMAHILNKLLPDDVAILGSRKVPAGFHARKSAVQRTYLYRILTSPRPDPFRAPFVWHCPRAAAFDISRMRQTAKKWIGTRDFSVFAIRISENENTRRHMGKIDIRKIRDEIRLTFTADAFLHRMVRRMVAVLADVGAGKSALKPSFAAPASGLCLLKVSYR